jgi:hypothetical protein
MIVTQEQAIFKAEKEFDMLVKTVREAASEARPIDKIERDLWGRILGMGRLLLQGFVDLQGSGDLGETLDHEGRILRRLEHLHDRRYVSVFGELSVRRSVYGTRESQKHEVVPLDARLCLPEGEFSYLLQEWDQAFCVQGSYQESAKTVERILGIGQSVRSLEHMNRSMARDVRGFHEEKSPPAPEEEGPILVLTADGKGVPMRKDPKPNVVPCASHARRKKGEKANKKRMACVGAVYTIEPFVRTAQDVVDEVLRKESHAKRPIPQGKEMRAKLTQEVDGEEVNAKDAIFKWFVEQIQARNGEGLREVVCVMDGERALWKMLMRYVPDAVCILDIFHALERLWDAAHCFCVEGSDAATAFVSERLERILEGGVGRVIGGLKQMLKKQKLRGSRKRRLERVIGYLENNRDLMRYDEYLEKGYPIGSGVVEGACRHLVKDRMELTGMRWRVSGAQSMLDLRAAYLNDDWDAFQEHRINENHERLYPNREAILSQCQKAA